MELFLLYFGDYGNGSMETPTCKKLEFWFFHYLAPFYLSSTPFSLFSWFANKIFSGELDFLDDFGFILFNRIAKNHLIDLFSQRL